MKKFLFKILIISFMFIFLVKTLNVSAKKLEIENEFDDNVGSVLVLNDIEFYVEVDEETKIGYVVTECRGVKEVIGTCDVTIVDTNNTLIENFCLSSDNNVGTMVITMDDGFYIITESHGDISNVFYVGASVAICNN